MKALLFTIAFTLAATLTAAWTQSAASDDFQSAKIIQTVDPMFPPAMISDHSNGAWVRIVINVDQDGHLADWLVLSYTHRIFADEAVSAIRQWQFEPALWQVEPVSVCIILTFNFEVKGVVVTITPSNTLNSLLSFVGLHDDYRPCTLRELDRIPIPLEAVAPAYPHALADPTATTEVTVEFYIDEQGNVRMPHALGRPSRMLAGLAVSAVAQWRFEPPTSHGKPVLVCVQQLFRFNPAGQPEVKS